MKYNQFVKSAGMQAEEEASTISKAGERKATAGGVLFYNAKQVCHMFGFSRTHLWRLQRSGEFPSPRELGPNRVGWLASEVIAWAVSRPRVEL